MENFIFCVVKHAVAKNKCYDYSPEEPAINIIVFETFRYFTKFSFHR